MDLNFKVNEMKQNILYIILLLTAVSCGQTGGNAPMDSLVIFISNTASNGNFGGPIQADAICMADSAKPSGGATYKAMLSRHPVRAACLTANCSAGTSEQIDWVLDANTNYVRPDGTFIDKTTENATFGDSIENSFSDTSYKVWTGQLADWTPHSNEDCNDWTSQMGFNMGAHGTSDFTDHQSWFFDRDFCNVPGRFYCVEQR